MQPPQDDGPLNAMIEMRGNGRQDVHPLDTQTHVQADFAIKLPRINA